MSIKVRQPAQRKHGPSPEAHGFVFEPLAHWAREQPSKPALISVDARVTYAELEATTNRLARALRARRVRSADRVAFVLPRGPQAVQLLIAILKAGAAYVPLDAESPQSRILDCLEDVQPSLVVLENGRDFEDLPTVTIEELWRAAEGMSDAPIDPGIIGADLAYIIFTSGTTGRPKGVPIKHRSLSNFITGNQEVCIRVEADDRVFQGFSPASDGHHEEVWPTLSAGATLVVARSAEVHSGHDLEAFLNENRVTIISCAPTLLSMVEGDVPSLRRILFGAENLPASMVHRWWKPDCEILNTYGPTEATVGATFSFCEPGKPITIGKPLPDYRCAILDGEGNELGDLEEGELAISGIGVSDGYFGRDDLTALKFTPSEQGGMTYRTGDRVRKLTSGDIVWLGRVDAQVKIRGHRVELSEIEAHLLAQPGVQSAVVTTRESEDGDTQLAALLVPQESFDMGSFLTAIRESLPGYMVPQTFEHVEKIPVLPSGKIDRRACQHLHGQAFRLEREIVPPRTREEHWVLEMWTELFPGAEISCTDDFFRDLGGYSLLASRFISAVRSDHGYAKVSVLDIYENPSIRSFASVLEAQTQPHHKTAEFKAVSARRYALAKVWQGLGVLILFGIQGLFWLGPIIAAIFFSAEVGHDDFTALLLGIGLHALSVPVMLLFAIAVKWTVGGRFKEGSYPLWGTQFVRWWFVHRVLANTPVNYLTGTPLAGLYLWALGAKVGRNVTFEALEIDCPDLIEIGSDCTFENSSWIHASSVAHGELHMRRVRVGNGCSLGVRAGLAGGSTMEDGAALRDLTGVVAGVTVPAGEEWEGSVGRAVPRTMPVYDPSAQPSRGTRTKFAAIQTALIVLLMLMDSVPFVTVAFTLYNWSEGFVEYLWEPVYAVVLVLFACTQILLVKWLVLGKLRAGTYAYPGTTWLRKWFSDKHLELVGGLIVPVYDSLFTRPWCILLGMKCGPRCEIALPRRMPYDLVEMGAESFLASEVSIGRPIRANGQIMLERTTIGSRTFLGNDSVVPQGANVPDDFLLGVLSVNPTNEQMGEAPDQAWLGSPPFRMPNRQVHEQFDVKQTYRPTKRMYAERLMHEAIRLFLPSLCFLIVASAMIEGFVWIWNESSLALALCSVPILYFGGVLIAIGIIRLSKFLLIGKYKPTIQPLWSRFVWKTETHSSILHDFGSPLFISDLEGTPFMSGLMRFLGAKIGSRSFINTTDWTETDLIQIGEDAAINANAPLQAHLFEDRVMKVGPIKIGERCTVGNYSVILCESELKNDSHVGNLSLVMKGETIPSHTFWAGSPAQSGEQA